MGLEARPRSRWRSPRSCQLGDVSSVAAALYSVRRAGTYHMVHGEEARIEAAHRTARAPEGSRREPRRDTMGTIGYAAMFEQFTPSDLLRWSQQAEEAGFGAVMASDHFNPWTPQQGQAGFVWSWLGALGATTKRVTFGTGVTAPGFRYHPAILAQAAATLAAMFPGRFYLGIGAGEALNEHVVGQYWPEAPIRL